MAQDENEIPLWSPLSVVRNFFGEWPSEQVVLALDDHEIEQFREHVLNTASDAAAAPVVPGTSYVGGQLSSFWYASNFATDLSLALLYYERLMVHDPLSDFFFRDWSKIPASRDIRDVTGISTHAGPDIWAKSGSYDHLSSDPTAARRQLAGLLARLRDLAPMVEAGVVAVRPQWPTILKRSTSLMASVRHDTQHPAMGAAVQAAEDAGTPLPVWDNLSGARVMTNHPVVRADEPWLPQHEFFYLAKTLSIADAMGAQYVAHTEAELGLVRAKAEQMSALRSIGVEPTAVLREVKRITLPDLELDVRTAVQMRKSEAAFEDWRRMLRALARDGRDDTMEELAERADDLLRPSVQAVSAAISKSAVAKASLRDVTMETLLTSSVGVVGTVATGTNPALGLATGLGSGALSWLWKAVRPPRLGGKDAVLATLIRKK